MGLDVLIRIPRSGKSKSSIVSSSSGRSFSSQSSGSESEGEMSIVRYSPPPSTTKSFHSQKSSKLVTSYKGNNVIQTLQKSIIGENLLFEGPFGKRRCLYLDQTASGRCVNSIEDFILENVMPVYGNTHTTTSFCASQISAYREEARHVVKRYCGGGPDDEVIFCGSGATAAVHKLVHSISKPGDQPPIVIIGPYEHHSNVLPWREITKDVFTVATDSRGYVDMKDLKHILESIHKRAKSEGRRVIGSFSAGSNVTGSLTDDVAVTTLLHTYGAFSFWDFAAAAPHVQIRMNPGDENNAFKDAIFFSGHKFLGGPQTPGVLVVKKHVLRNPVPHGHGGGTVQFVTRDNHQYVKDDVERNEGGTPDIIGSIRLGLVLQMQSSFGIENVIKREADFTRKTLSDWARHLEIVVLGHQHSIRLPIVSFMIRHLQTGFFLHQDFIVALLNDLFGIQCRSGCMCAGPFAQGLLGMDQDLAQEYENILSQPRHPGSSEVDMVFKPGFIRMSLPYHATIEEIDFSIQAVIWVAKNGWKLLPFYKMDVTKGTFRFNGSDIRNQVQRKTISSFSLDQSLDLNLVISHMDSQVANQEECLDFASQLVESVQDVVPDYRLENYDDTLLFSPDRLDLRWFLLPSEALQCIKYPEYSEKPCSLPFEPKLNYKSPNEQNKLKSGNSIPHNMELILSAKKKVSLESLPVKEMQIYKQKTNTSLLKVKSKRSG